MADEATIREMLDGRLGETSEAASSAGTILARLAAIANSVEAKTGTADSGLDDTLVDSTLTESDSKAWLGATVVLLTGSNAGLSRTIVSFTPGSDQLGLAPDLPAAISPGDEYVILPTAYNPAFFIGGDDDQATILGNSLMDQVYIGAGEQLRNFLAKTGASEVPTGVSLADMVGILTGVTTETFTFTTDTTIEQDVFEETGITQPTEVVAILDLNALTQDATIRVKEKIDGSTYRTVDPAKEWTTADEDGVRITFTAHDDFKVTIQSGTDEGANRSIPVKRSHRVRA